MARRKPQPETPEVEVEDASRALATIDPQALIQTAIERGATIETIERLVDLAKDVQATLAKRLYHAAMAKFHEQCPPIYKTARAEIRTKSGGTYHYSYAPLEDIESIAFPVMGQLGLYVSYRVRHDAQQVFSNCRITHEAGHFEESGEVAMPITEYDGTGANPAQRVGIASAYAKRYSLLAALGRTPETDPDGSLEGQPATVQMPTRKGDAVAEKPSGKPPTEEGGGRWRGSLKDVEEKVGQTKGKPWTIYTIVGGDGTRYGTFDSEMAKIARRLIEEWAEAEIEWEATQRGRRLLAIEEA